MFDLTIATSHKPQATSHKPQDSIVAKVPVQGALFYPSTLLILLTLVGWQSHAWATDDPAKTSATPVAPDDLFDWSGDTVILHTDLSGVTQHDDANSKTNYCVPAKSKLHISKENKTSHKLTMQVAIDDNSSCLSSKNSPLTLTNAQTAYDVDKIAIEDIPHSRRGWTFGALLVPFKYQLSDKSLSGATTVGPYLGYRLAAPFDLNFLQGTSTTFVVSTGLVNNIAVPTAPSVTPAGSVNRTGWSLATGVIFAVDKGTGIQVGLLLGQDRLGSNAVAPYAYEGKTWVSVSVGYKFF